MSDKAWAILFEESGEATRGVHGKWRHRRRFGTIRGASTGAGIAICSSALPVQSKTQQPAAAASPAALQKDQVVLEAIERIVGDDFCVDLDMRQDDLSGDLKILHEKVSLIYRMAHSHVRSHKCSHVHDDWRELTRSQIKRSEGAFPIYRRPKNDAQGAG